VAEWLRSGLQSRLHRFDSGRRLLLSYSRTALAVAVAGCSIAACGSGSSPHTPSLAATTHPASTRAPAPKTRRAAHRPRIGATEVIRAGGTALAVTIAHLIDPLSGSGAALQPGTQAVGAIVRIENRGPGIYDSSATGDFSVVPSSGGATPLFAPHGVCQTPLRDFDNYISPGEIRHGCVAFAIDADARVSAVRFSPHGQALGRVTWATSG
jgi:hypothetical protein